MNTMRSSRFVGAAVFAVALGLALSAQAIDSQTQIYSFVMSEGGYYPYGELLRDNAGNLYGATAQGGTSTSCGSYGCGTIFELSPTSGGGWSYSVLYNFNDYAHDAGPLGSLVMDAAGNLYGATVGFSSGEIFELSPNGSGGWTENVLYVFGGTLGIGSGPVILDAEGNLWGSSNQGGVNNAGFVFELSPGSGGWTLQDIHDFNDHDGQFPEGGVILDKLGNVYGTTRAGGNASCTPFGCGVAFEIEKGEGTWTEKVLREFSGDDGSAPWASMTMDAKGNLYGTTSGGGTDGFGTVFELKLVSGKWQASTLYNFTEANGDGAFPNSPLAMDAAGDLYGTTNAGGGGLGDCVGQGKGCGEAFELSPAANKWKHINLYSFNGERSNGAFPSGIILGASGDLFGIVQSGGKNLGGAVFELSPK